jgi:hypothetical protein
MTTDYKIEADGTITITTKFKPEGSMLEQEEQIAATLAAAGRLATQLILKGFDTEGQSLITDNQRYTSRGQEKKTTRPRTEKLK